MKFACCSTAFDEQLRTGGLTQLEWIDLSAHALDADGIVPDLRHFPRTDTDYLAQVKKMCVDLGLTLAALRHDGFFAGDEPHVEQAFEIALALGTPVLSAPLPPETSASWSELQQRLGIATSLAKKHNVTLGVRNAPRTFAASSHDLKRVSKEADSAWLRYAPDFGALEPGSDAQVLLAKTVLVWADCRCEPSAALLEKYRGFVVLDAAENDARADDMKNALARWRNAFQMLAEPSVVDRT